MVSTGTLRTAPAAAFDLPADLPLTAYHRVNARVGDHLPSDAAGDASRLASRSGNHEIGNVVDPADQPSARATCSDLEPEGGFEPPTCRLRGHRRPTTASKADRVAQLRKADCQGRNGSVKDETLAETLAE
jgi:hypothetical protein